MNPINSSLLAVLLCLAGWVVFRILAKPVCWFQPIHLTVHTEYANQRLTSKWPISMESGLIPLMNGLSQFYLIIDKQKASWHHTSDPYLLKPILRGSEDVVLLKVSVRVQHERITRVNVTNLSGLNAQLTWRRAIKE
jgi:hypothetical protein